MSNCCLSCDSLHNGIVSVLVSFVALLIDLSLVEVFGCVLFDKVDRLVDPVGQGILATFVILQQHPAAMLQQVDQSPVDKIAQGLAQIWFKSGSGLVQVVCGLSQFRSG